MRKTTHLLWVVAVMGLLVNSATADVTYDDGDEHVLAGMVGDGVEVNVYDGPLGGPTGVEVASGGWVYRLHAYENSNISVSGGKVVYGLYSNDSSNVVVNGGDVGWGVHAEEDSSVAVTSGKITGHIYAYDTSDVVVSGGVVYDNINAYGNSEIAISDGRINNAVWAYEDSHVTISGGVVPAFDPTDNNTASISGGDVWYVHASGASRTDITGGSFNGLEAKGASRLVVSGGDVAMFVRSFDGSSLVFSGDVTAPQVTVYDSSNIVISGNATLGQVGICNTSYAEVSGGDVTTFFTNQECEADISGGSFSMVGAFGTSSITFRGYDFQASDGLLLDGDEVLGTGTLTGKWFDGTPWSIPIDYHDVGATILAVPEPTTISLLALGGVTLMRSRRRR